MQLTAKLARVRIADDVFQSGDRILLPNISITLGEDMRSSTCSFTLNDPGLLIGAKYREISVKGGGILVPSELLSSPQPPTQQATGAAPSTEGATPNTPLTNYPAGSKDEVVLGIVRECLKKGITDPVKVAFTLAVAEGESGINHKAYNPETNNSAVTDKRFGGRGLVQITHKSNYQLASSVVGVDLVANPDLAFRPDISTTLLIWGLKRGWCSRGGIDKWITGANQNIGAAYRAIQGGVWGSRYQGFFNKWLKAAPGLIQQAGGASTPAPPPPPPPADLRSADPMGGTPTPSAPVQVAPTQESSFKGTEIIIELAVGWGATWTDAIAFHFIHTGTSTGWDASGAQTTTFEGRSIRWLLTRVTQTQSFENINLRQFAELQLSGFNLKLEMEGSGLDFQHLSQDGATTLSTLFRESKRLGFRIGEGSGKKSNTIVLEPAARPKFTNFIIDEEVLIKPARFTDKARAATSPAPSATVSAPETGTGETKTSVDRETGSIKQTLPESKAGTGQAPASSKSATGATAPPVGGTVKPSATATATPATPPKPPVPSQPSTPANAPNTTSKTDGPVKITKPDGTVIETTVTTEEKLEPGKITRTKTTKVVTTKGSTSTTSTTVVKQEVTESKTKTITTVTQSGKQPETTTKEEPKVSVEDKKKLQRSLTPSSPTAAPGAGAAATADPTTGLPNQQPGFIDLADGRAEAQTIADESRRVKGYEDEVLLVMNPDTLKLVPGEIVALSKRLFPDAFATEKRIGGVAHDFAAGTTVLQLYTPQAALPAGAAVAPAPGEVATPTQFATPATAPGKFIFPVPKGATTIGDGYGTRRNRPPGYMHTILDITAPVNTPAVAMADGVVTAVRANAGGAGNLLTIKYGGGYESTFMHGVAGKFALVAVGAQVKQGQPVFLIDSTGGSSGHHLHLKFTLNGSYCLLSKVGIDVLKMGLPLRQYNKTCNQY